jgi:TfoX/Sxy family transcriptional regulator of competence genes
MSYDEKLAERLRGILAGKPGVDEKKMFGGLAFLLDGKMFCGVIKDNLMARVGLDDYEQAIREPHARPMDFTGRPLKGFVYVGPKGHAEDASLERWIRRGAEFVASLPAKKPKAPAKKRARK